MPKTKIALTIDESVLVRLDRLVAAGRFPNRSQAIEAAVRERVDRLERSRLAAECEKLDPEREQSEAEVGFAADSAAWPEY